MPDPTLRLVTPSPADDTERARRIAGAAPEMLRILRAVMAECADTFFDHDDLAPEWQAIEADARAVIDLIDGTA
jgi:malate synthase